MSAAALPHECSSRRRDFHPIGHTLDLGSRGRWTIPVPRIDRGVSTGVEGASVVPAWCVAGRQDPAVLTLLASVVRAKGEEALAIAGFALVARLVRANYDLSPAQARDLLFHGIEDPARARAALTGLLDAVAFGPLREAAALSRRHPGAIPSNLIPAA